MPQQDRLGHLKRQCQPHLMEAARESVEGICLKIYAQSCDFAKRIHDQRMQFNKENNLPGTCCLLGK